jgi:hypothetical protein
MSEVKTHIEEAEKALARASGNNDQTAAMVSIAHILLAFWCQKYHYRVEEQ